MLDKKVCFIGLGTMGLPMAKNIADFGYEVFAYDINKEVELNLKGTEIKFFHTASEAALGCSLVITMLPTSCDVREALFGKKGALKNCLPNSLIVEMSTGSVKQLIRLGKDLKATGYRLIDAPVGRSKIEAATGKLLVMVGGETKDVKEANNIFKAVADQVEHVGPLGFGLKVKLVNNYMTMVNSVLTGEVLAFAQQLGLDLTTVVKILSTTSAGLGELNTSYSKKALIGDFTPDFSIKMAIKDLKMALELSSDVQNEAYFGTLAKTLFTEATRDGLSELDKTAILKFFETKANIIKN